MVLYIAETDINGRICCVWHKRPGHKAARPVQAFSEVRHHLEGADYAGARPAAIREFLMTLGTATERHTGMEADTRQAVVARQGRLSCRT